MKSKEFPTVREGLDALREGIADVVVVEEDGLTYIICKDQPTEALVEPHYVDLEPAKCETEMYPTLVILPNFGEMEETTILLDAPLFDPDQWGDNGLPMADLLAAFETANIVSTTTQPVPLVKAEIPDWLLAYKPAGA